MSSKKNISEDDILRPSLPSKLTSSQMLSGQRISPVKIVGTYEAGDFEIFISEWITSTKTDVYKSVKRCGGGGDMGRDVIGYYEDSSWDNYQCKRYKSALGIGDAALEVAKHIYYAHEEKFKPAKKFYFVASGGVSAPLHSLLENPEDLKKDVKTKWEKNLYKELVAGEEIKLEGSLLLFLDAFDFSIFNSISIDTIIAEHQKTPFYPARFGGGLQSARLSIPSAPSEPGAHEQTYVQKLFEMYGEKLSIEISKLTDLKKFKNELEHFEMQRASFYAAESLREFSRDNLLNDSHYNSLLKEFYDIIVEIVEEDYVNGYARLIGAIRSAASIDVTNHPLGQEIKSEDRKGMQTKK